MSIDSCQIKKPADQCHMTISGLAILRGSVAQDGAQRKYTGQLGSKYAKSLQLFNLIWEIHFMVN